MIRFVRCKEVTAKDSIPTFDGLMAIVKSAIVKDKTRARIRIEQK
jgi:hypothetical protein